jgi:diguanylate cyclase (GGDEF)-like protein
MRSVISSVLVVVGGGFVAAASAIALLGSSSSPASLAVVTLLLGLVCGLVIFLLLQRNFMARLRKMLRTLQRASDTNYVARCEAGLDELGALGAEINVLLQRLTDLSVDVIDADRELAWTQKELKFKEELANKSRLLQATNDQLEGRLKELSQLFDVSRTLNSSLEMDVLMERLCEVVGRTIEVDRFTICVWNERRKALVVRGLAGFGDDGAGLLGMRVYPGEGIAGTVYEKRTMVYVRDLVEDQRFLHFRGKAQLKGSLLALPLPSGDQCVGVVLFQREKVDAFSFEDVGLYHIIANQVSGAVSNSLLYQMTRELAIHDELTGLYNRRMLERRLEMEWERANRFGSTLACIMLDVDHFKQFNDDFGHLVGDEVLRVTGKLLQKHVRKVDSLARFGGEEFAVLLPRTDKVEAAAVAEKLRESMSEARLSGIDGSGVHLTVSCGVASTEDSPDSSKQLVDMADHALLLAKNQGRNRVVVYGSSGGEA